jgi:flagellar biosynthetic protein FliP
VVRVRLPTALARLVSREDGTPVSLPRESLLAGTSILFGVLSALFWIIGRPSSRATHLVLAAILAASASHSAVADEVASAANSAAAVEPRDAEGPVRQPTAGVDSLASVLERLFAGRSLGTSLSAVLLFGIASLAPAVLLMTTSFVRMSVVLSLVRQGIGTPHLPSNQVVTSLAIFLTALVMWPVWTAVWREGVEPYSEGRVGLAQALDGGVAPLRRWMTGQIQAAGNADTLGFFVARAANTSEESAVSEPTRNRTPDAEPPIEAVLPAFLVSELEVAFAIGLRLLVPFLVLDVVVATIVTAAGLVSLSPATVALPLKLLVFVVADGWTLIVKSLLDGFALVG